MKKTRILLWLAAILAVALPVAAPAVELTALFPDLDGWSRDGGVKTFQPENLYEHINGAAENFLAYDFRQLAVQNYADRQKRTLSAEIYSHGTPENAFGIYGSEKPLAGNYLPIGAQGYYEEGVLNFISGAYYIKLNGFDLGSSGRQVLLDLAGRIAVAIGGRNSLPEILDIFPAAGRIANSERYLLRNFLGHGFLHSAFTVDYERQGRKLQLFIITAGSEDEARDLLQKYAALDKEGPPAVRPGELVIRDPYNGPVRLFWRGAFICGGVGQSEEMEALIKDLRTNLMEKQKK